MTERVKGYIDLEDENEDFADYSESALLDYITDHAGIIADTAWYDIQYDRIMYIYDADVEEQEIEPHPEWSEKYLNYIGMSMSDFL